MKWIEIKSFKLKKKRRTLQCLHIKNKNAKNNKNIILFSQSQKTNLGTILPRLIDISNFFKISIITYEYTNCINQSKVIEDCNLLYDYLTKIDSISSIYLMGISMGTFANFSVISEKSTKINNIIAISPTWVFTPMILRSSEESNKAKKEINQIFELINRFNIPVLVVHGKKDNYVKYLLSLSLTRRINKVMEWYPKDGKHLNILETMRTKLFIKMSNFYMGFYGKKNLNLINQSGGNNISINKFSHNNNLSTFSNFDGHFNQNSNYINTSSSDTIQPTSKIVDETPIFDAKKNSTSNEHSTNFVVSFNPEKVSEQSNENDDTNSNGKEELYGTFMPGDVVPSMTNPTSSIVKSNANNGFTFVDNSNNVIQIGK